MVNRARRDRVVDHHVLGDDEEIELTQRVARGFPAPLAPPRGEGQGVRGFSCEQPRTLCLHTSAIRLHTAQEVIVMKVKH